VRVYVESLSIETYVPIAVQSAQRDYTSRHSSARLQRVFAPGQDLPGVYLPHNMVPLRGKPTDVCNFRLPLQMNIPLIVISDEKNRRHSQSPR
jgi:hypothetical protein